MTIFQIQCFLSAAQTLNFTEAANGLFIAQSSLSRNISHLEEELGIQLFTRTKKYVRLTPGGAVLYEEFTKLLAMGERALERARQAELGENGAIRLGVLETQRSENFLPERLNKIRAEHPNIKIDIASGTFRELRESLLSDQLDIVLTLSFDLEDYPADEIVWQVFFHSQPKCVISKANTLAQSVPFDLGLLSQENMVAISPDISLGAYHNILAFCERHNVTPAGTIFADSIQSLLLKVEAGLGFSILDQNCISNENSSVLSIPFYKTEPLNVIAIWRKENRNPVIPLFSNLFLSPDGAA